MYSLISVTIFTIIVSFFFRKDCIEQKILNFEQTQYLKGIAILIIILCHTIGQAKETVIATPLGGIGVGMFLFMSGYGLQESFKKNKLSGFWRKKILRIFIPYTLFISIKSIFLDNFSFSNYLLDIFFIHTSYWYIGYLIRWYIFFWLSSLFNEKYKLSILSVGSLLSLCLLPEIEAEQSISFVLGVLVSIKIENIRLLPNKSIYTIAISALVVGMSALAVKQLPVVRQNDIIFLICQLLIKLPTALGLIILCGKLMPKNKLILICGAYSLELYLIHMQTLKIIQYNTTLANILSTSAFILITFILCYSFNLLCKKVNRIFA